jgi:uncharacterized protein YaiI (UPF0178 family)
VEAVAAADDVVVAADDVVAADVVVSGVGAAACEVAGSFFAHDRMTTSESRRTR